MPRGTERLAIALAFVGMLAALLRALAWPWLPKLVPVALIVTALGLLLIGIVRRARWHAASRDKPEQP